MGVGGQRHAPAAFTPGKEADTHCTGGWVGPCGNHYLFQVSNLALTFRDERQPVR
jgi:hypothetical protein